MKKFKTESQKILDLMINSIYTHKEIFVRELLSNASDAIDKLYYKTLTDGISGLAREDFEIKIEADKKARILTISDNGIGMTDKELDENLGVIARSGSQEFKKNNENNEEINIIGQFGVGFYSAFMVSEKVEVFSKAYGSEDAYVWSSNGSDGYEIKKTQKDGHGTSIVMYLRDDTEEEDYTKFLDEYHIKGLVKKYSDYIRYPIKMEMQKYVETGGEQESVSEIETLNSMVPLWKKNKNEISEEEYNSFYMDNFHDFEKPARVINVSVEGKVDYKALLFIPSHPPYDFYSKNFEKGLKLYTDGVLITDCCKDLLPDYFGFVKGLVDSQLTLNVSRETIQRDAQLRFIANNIEKKVKNELIAMQGTDRENYEKFYKGFARQIKYGIYENWGEKKDVLQDLLMFHSIKDDKMITLAEYVQKMPESQKFFYYAAGMTVEGIKALPRCEKILDDGYDIICLTEDVDEFIMKVLHDYNGKEFKSITSYDDTTKENEVENKELTDFIKETLKDQVSAVVITTGLKSHPASISTKGELSMEMEKVLNSASDMTGNAKAIKVLEINANHSIYEKLKGYLETDKDKLAKISKVIFAHAMLVEGGNVDNPTELAEVFCELL